MSAPMAVSEFDVEQKPTTSSNSDMAINHTDTITHDKPSDSISVSPSHSSNYDQHANNDVEKPNDGQLRRTQSNVLTRVASRCSRTSTIEPPPDGGLKAWTQCGMAWLVMFCTWGLTNAFGCFQPYYTTTLGVSASTVSWIGSVNTWLLFFISTFSGRALDAGLYIPTMCIGVAIQLVGLFTTSVSRNLWQLLLSQGVATGLGSGIIFCPTMALCATYFSSHRGLAVAIATSGNSAGGMIYPIVVTRLLPVLGFGWTVRVLGFINLGCLALVLALARPRLPPRTSGPLIEWSAFRELPYMLFVAGVFISFWAVYWTFYYVASYAETELGMPYTDAVNLLIVLNGIGFPGRIFCGFIADRFFGVLNTFAPLVLINALITLCWLAVTSQTGFYPYVCFLGIFSAAFQSLFPTSIASLTSDIRKTGTRLGMAFSMLSFAGLTGPPIGGALIGVGGRGYVPPIVWAGVCLVVGGCLVTASRISKVGRSLKVKC